MEIKTFTCGHQGEVPRNMGRGQAREKRLTAYFGRKCKTCAQEAIRSFHASLTKSVKTLEERLADVERNY